MVPTQLVPLLFGLAAAILWGVADFLATKSSRKNSPETTALWVSMICAIAYTAVFVVNPGQAEWAAPGIIYALAAGICLELGLYSFYRGLTVGPVSLVAPISGAYPLVTTLLVVVIFNDALRGIDYFGILLVVAGVLLASGISESRKSDRKLSLGVRYALKTILYWGLAYALLDQAINRIGWQKSMLIDFYAGLAALIILLAFTAKDQLKTSFKPKHISNYLLLGTAAIQLLGGVVFSIGLAHSHSAAIITAISACYPSITVFLALKHFREQINIVPLTGGFITITGVVVLVL